MDEQTRKRIRRELDAISKEEDREYIREIIIQTSIIIGITLLFVLLVNIITYDYEQKYCEQFDKNYYHNTKVEAKDGFVSCCIDYYENNLKVDTNCIAVDKDG